MVIQNKNKNCFNSQNKKEIGKTRVRLVHMFKNWKWLFKNIYGNMCEWKSMWKWVKYCLKTENNCLKTQIKHLPNLCLFLVLLLSPSSMWKPQLMMPCPSSNPIATENKTQNFINLSLSRTGHEGYFSAFHCAELNHLMILEKRMTDHLCSLVASISISIAQPNEAN